ncbi:phosphoribosylamine--glycine ligase [Miltoncostaea marina]|uniref:phosphoribosylamine--glycine ligase n=1 Tax=Miltoncostaea marina TaxID=2843215 RepID=UPI001FEAA4EC|nr:phosphoribosylamine--glycine ligase [Miltoncostaea marina]
MSRTVLVVGGGGREHALVRALARCPERPRILCAGGNAGIARDAELIPLDLADVRGVAALAPALGVDLVVVGPEAPLVAGMVDAVRAAGVRAFGPSAAAARLEGSKAFAKEVMAAAGVPTARAVTVTDLDAGLAAVDELGLPVAVKADGLAAGKGVVVARTREEARDALAACLVDGAFGDAGRVVVVEEGMTGPEVSLLAITDGSAVARFPAARDYKPIGEGNTGPNTGGMGSVSPVPDIPDDLADELVDRVHRPVIAEMARRGTPVSGVLYAGLMMTPDGPRVLEFNTRFGDPETQALLPRLQDDLLGLLTACADGGLPDRPVRVHDGAAVTVVLASHGYPGSPRTGDVILGLEEAAATGAEIYHCGTAPGPDGTIVTAGGRVLAVSARGADVAEARARAYEAAGMITFEGRQMRGDIAAGMEARA